MQIEPTGVDIPKCGGTIGVDEPTGVDGAGWTGDVVCALTLTGFYNGVGGTGAWTNGW